MADPKFEITAVDKFSRVVREAKNQLGGLKSSLGGLTSVAGSLSTSFAGLGAVLSVGGLVAGVRSIVDGIDDLADSAQGLGVTATALSEMQVSARTAGVGTEELGTALTKLNVRMTDAISGGKDSQAIFKALGISVKDARGNLKGTDEVLGEVADAFSKYRDGAEKSALAVELFGRSGAKLIGYLNGGATGLKTYSGLTEETVKETAKLAAEFDKLAANATQAKNAIAGVLVPAINALFDAARDDTINAPDKVLARINARLETLRVQAGQRQNPEFLQAIRLEIEALEKSAKSLSQEIESSGIARFQAGNAAVRRLDNPRSPAPVISNATVPKASEITDSQRALAQYVDQLVRAQDALEGIGEVEKTLQFLKENPQIDTPQTRELLLTQAEIVDALKAEKALREAIAQATGQQLASEKALRDSVLEAAGILDDQRKVSQTAELEKLIGEGLINPEQAERAVKAIAGIRDEVEKTKSVSDELGLIFESAFEDAILSARSLGDVLKGLAQDLARLFLRQNVTKPLFDFLGTAFSFGGGRAVGGPVSAGSTYLVGERGPELLAMGANSGRIVPNGSLGGVTVVQNIRIDSRSDASSIRQAMEATRRQTEASIMDSMNRRGAFARA